MLFYDTLKILHIISATLLLMSFAYCFNQWRTILKPDDLLKISPTIQKQTLYFVIPLALIQLSTGFTMISLKFTDFSQLWIIGSVIGFIVVIVSWFAFIYFLLMSQQLITVTKESIIVKFKLLKSVQYSMLVLCGLALLSMIFFMANKIS